MSKHKLPDIAQEVARAYSMEELRATEEGVIEGYAAVYEEKTAIGNWFYEIIARGAFDGTDFDDVLLSTNHDLKKIPLARSRRNNANSTLQLTVDEKGLGTKANLDIANNSDARALHSAVQRGDIDGMSFIFFVQDEEWRDLDSDMPTRIIKSIKKVKEVSAVSFPSYKGTDINARDTLENAKNALDNARSTELDNTEELEKLKLKNQIKAKG